MNKRNYRICINIDSQHVRVLKPIFTSVHTAFEWLQGKDSRHWVGMFDHECFVGDIIVVGRDMIDKERVKFTFDKKVA